MVRLQMLYVIFFLLYSCNDSELQNNIQQRIIATDNYKKIEANNNLQIIKLDELNNFKSLLGEMGELDCKGLSPVLFFEYEKTTYKLDGYYGCPNKNYGVSCYFRVNHIFIHNDSVYTKIGRDKIKEPTENLGNYLQDIILNANNYKWNENKLKKAIIHLSIDEKYSIDKTKKALSHITEEFKKIEKTHGKGFFEYHIIYEPKDFLTISPPPPPSPSNTD